LQSHDFFITGESYAGVYIPTLAYEILTNAADDIPNLKGLAVGDPCTDNTAQQESMDSLWYSHKYGLVDDAIFDTLWNHCEVRIPNIIVEQQHLFRHPFSVAGQKNQSDASGLNSSSRVHQKYRKLLEQYWQYPESARQGEPACKLAFRKFLLSSSRGLSQGWEELFIDDYSLFAPVTNEEDIAMANYMNRYDVQQALHVADNVPNLKAWPYPNAGFDYLKEYDACNSRSKPGALSMIDFYRKIVPRLKVVWVYNGDTDPCLSYEGTRTAIKRIGFQELDGGSYRLWFYN
jgi:serine carboxypeptidase-like clade 1